METLPLGFIDRTQLPALSEAFQPGVVSEAVIDTAAPVQVKAVDQIESRMAHPAIVTPDSCLTVTSVVTSFTFHDRYRDQHMTRRIVVIGAGIAGVATAACVSEVEGVDVVVLDRGPRGSLLGSTGLAPGLVGLFNEAPVLTKLAQGSVLLEHFRQASVNQIQASGLK